MFCVARDEQGRRNRQVSDADLQALIGILAVLQGELLAGSSDELALALRRRMSAAGLMTATYEETDVGRLQIALDDLNQRLRYAVGECDEVPEPRLDRAATRHDFSVPDDGRARAFAQALRASGAGGVIIEMGSDEPKIAHVSGTFPELAPNPDFFERRAQVRELVARHGGRYRGSHGT